MERIDTLEERIKEEIEELAKRTIEMENDIDKYKHPEQLHSAGSTKDNLSETSEKCSRQIELLDKLAEMQDAVESDPELQELKAKAQKQSQELRSLAEKEKNAKNINAYGNIKTECLQLITRLNERLISPQ